MNPHDGRRERDRVRREILEDTAECCRRRMADAQCGSALTDLAGFDRDLLRRYGLLLDRRTVLCGRMARADRPAGGPAAATTQGESTR